MSYCKICGSTIGDYDNVCANCGTPVNKKTADETGTPANPTRESASGNGASSPVVGSWGYVGSILLLGLPLIGFIVAIVWAFGGVSNQNLRNLARANLLLLLIWTVVLLGVLLSVLVRFGSLMYLMNYLVGLFG